MARTRTLALGTMLLGSLLLAAPAGLLAQSPPADPPRQQQGPHDRFVGRMKDRLGLTDDQAKAIREVYQRQAQGGRERWQKLRAAQKELRQLAIKGGDEAAVRAKSAEVQKLMSEGLEARVKALQEIAPILTPEQREKFAAMELGPRGRRGRGHHGRDRGRS
jgi:Spy/CpxP family protein refolding chaperone